MSRLFELQARWWRAVVEGGAEDSPGALFEGPDAEQVLEHHRLDYLTRFARSLAAVYPCVAQLLGPPFVGTCADFLRERPPASGRLLDVALDFGGHLAQRFPSSWISDLAVLERSVHRANTALHVRSVREVPVAANVRVEAVPTLELVTTERDAARGWWALTHGELLPDTGVGAFCCVVVRHDWEVRVRPLDAAAAQAVARLLAGEALAPADVPQLDAWAADGWFCRIEAVR